MLLSSDELNYLVWRYLQECGYATTAHLLDVDSKCLQLDATYGKHTPAGTLPLLVQRGIFYTEADALVDELGNVTSDVAPGLFTLLRALSLDLSIPPVDPAAPAAPPTDEAFAAVLLPVSRFAPSATVACSPTEPLIVQGGAQVSLIRPDNEPVVLAHPADSPATVVAFAKNGSLVAVAEEGGDIRLWTTAAQLRLVLALHTAPVLALAWSPDSRHLALLDTHGRVVVWDVTRAAAVYLAESPQAAAVGGVDLAWVDSAKVAYPTGQHELCIVAVAPVPAVVATLSHHSATVLCVTYSDEAKKLVSASDDGEVCVWGGASSTPVAAWQAHKAPVVAAGWVGSAVVTAALDGSVRVWDSTGRPRGVGLNGVGIATAVVRASQVVTGGTDGVVRVWEVEGRKVTLTGEYSGEESMVAEIAAEGGDFIAVCYGDGADGVVVRQ